MPPSVSVLLPVRDEVEHIDEVLASLVAQDHTGEVEIVVADGRSTDGTRERLEDWQRQHGRLRVVDNERRVQSHGLNLAATHAAGEVLVRADGHTLYAPDYVRRSVEVLERSGATAVGGNLRPQGRTPFGRAVEAVMSSPLAIGPGSFHHADEVLEVDTVYLGAYRARDFERLGGFRHLPSGVAEDADLYYRWRQQGATVLLDPTIRSTYRPRETPWAFLRQSWRYGVGKAEMLFLNHRFPSWRPLAPLSLALGLLAGVGLGLATGRWWPVAVVAGAWLALVGTVAARADAGPGRVALAVAIMHLGYGAGLLWGLLRGPGAVRDVDRSGGS